MSRYRRSRARGSTFFFTIALADRSSSALADHIGLLRIAYRRVLRARSFHTLAICVLPDHLHAIWRLPANDRDFSARWSWIKSGFSRELPAPPLRSRSKRSKRDKGIWQRRFWEHEIRDDVDLERHVEYTHYNPVKHGLVRCVSEWPYSSFHRYVRSGLVSADWDGCVESDTEAKYGEP